MNGLDIDNIRYTDGTALLKDKHQKLQEIVVIKERHDKKSLNMNAKRQRQWLLVRRNKWM